MHAFPGNITKIRHFIAKVEIICNLNINLCDFHYSEVNILYFVNLCSGGCPKILGGTNGTWGGTWGGAQWPMGGTWGGAWGGAQWPICGTSTLQLTSTWGGTWGGANLLLKRKKGSRRDSTPPLSRFVHDLYTFRQKSRSVVTDS